MEDGLCGLDRSSRAPGGISVFCVLGDWLNVLPFFLGALCFVSDS